MKRVNIGSTLLAVNLLFLPVLAVQADERGSGGAAGHVHENVTSEVRKEVLQAVEQWRQAVVNADRAGLERAYHDDLTYGHTDGEVLGKQQQIDRTLLPDRSFPAVDLTDVGVRVYGSVALVTAKIAFHVQRGETKNISRLSGVDAWLKTPRGWQLVARQLTRPPVN